MQHRVKRCKSAVGLFGVLKYRLYYNRLVYGGFRKRFCFLSFRFLRSVRLPTEFDPVGFFCADAPRQARFLPRACPKTPNGAGSRLDFIRAGRSLQGLKTCAACLQTSAGQGFGLPLSKTATRQAKQVLSLSCARAQQRE